jgi:hypothetical protein
MAVVQASTIRDALDRLLAEWIVVFDGPPADALAHGEMLQSRDQYECLAAEMEAEPYHWLYPAETPVKDDAVSAQIGQTNEASALPCFLHRQLMPIKTRVEVMGCRIQLALHRSVFCRR